MKQNPIMVCDYRYDEGIRPRKDFVCPTLRAKTYNGQDISDKPLIIMEETMDVKVIGKMDHTIDHTFESANRVYDDNGIAPTVNTCGGGGLQPKIIVAMRGRNPENPSDRTAGSPTEQRLEPNSQGLCNTLTSVQKDNLVMETIIQKPRGFNNGGIHEICTPITSNSWQENNFVSNTVCKIEKVGQISNDGSQYGTVVGDNGLSPNLVAGTHGYANSCIHTKYRIRKLTPLECWRLMSFSDEDFNKAQEINSNTQLYKQAGNSIVKNVLMAILGQLIPGAENIYKEDI